jgi:hypothetical protein
MKIPFSQAALTVHCLVHDVDVEFYPDDDALSPLDLLQLRCPGLDPVIRRLHEQSALTDMLARKSLGLRWRAEHPDEARLLPADYVKIDGWTFDEYPEGYKLTLQSLDQQEEREADECLASWVVSLTIAKEVKREHASQCDGAG